MNEASEKVTAKRCAIYTRKSTDEGLDKDYNSLEAQFDACAAYIHSQSGKGWTIVDKHYDDGGYSGGNMNRPGLQELLKDVNEGKIDVVVVYKLDRISRSLRDFTELDGIFSRHGASMVSVTQQIDTSTSMGRMIVNLLMSFAQFEREMTSDRVRDKMAASRKKGIWTGGVIPYGYKSIDSKLVPDPENAPKVLYAFQRFAITRSYLETSRELNEKYGNHHADKRWNVMHVRTLLNMAWPAGRVRDTKTGELFEGQHEAIVPFELWLTVQHEIESRRKGHQTARSESSAPLKGLLKCGYCGCAMIPTYSGKKVPGRGTFHYYRCNNTHKHVTEESQLKNISGAAIEEPIFNLVEKLITNEYFLNLVSDPEEVAELRKLAANKVSLIKTMTRVELRRLAQIFIREVKVRKDGIDLVVRGDGFKKLMGKE